jgi:hypothetical protein
MQSVADIYAVWPSDADLARDIGVPYPTAAAWKQRGSIPVAYWRALLAAARKRGHREITANLLVDLHAGGMAGPAGFAEEERPYKAADRSSEPESSNDTGRGEGHFSRHKHLRRAYFNTAQEIEDHISALREEWSHR